MPKTQVGTDLTQRSIVKAIVYRILIMCSDGFIVYFITRRYDVALGVILFSNLASSIIYFVHERAWAGVHWGKTT